MNNCKLCSCCTEHPEETNEKNPIVDCRKCGEQCQCDGCVVEDEFDARL